MTPSIRPEGCALATSDEGERFLVALAPAGRVPFEVEPVASFHPPGRLAEARREPGSHAALRGEGQPVRMHAGDIETAGYAGAHQVGQHHDLAGILGVGIGIDQRRELVERIAPERRRPDVLEQALGDRLVAGMAMDVDEARHDHDASAVDHHVRLTGIRRPDMGDCPICERDVDALLVAVSRSPRWRG